MPAGRAVQALEWTRNRGRNGWDLASDLLKDQTDESLNIVLGNSALGTKRNGTVAQSISGTFTGYAAIARFVAGQNDTAAQLIIIDRSATTKIGRVTASTAFTNLTLTYPVLASQPWEASFATLNGKIYIAVRLASSVSRLLVYDPTGSTSLVRPSGFATPAAPTAANGAAGGPAATLRYYRVAWAANSGSNTRRKSLWGAAVSFTNTVNLVTTVTQPTPPGEGETHWYVAGSEDGVLYYIISAAIAIGTTTYTDAASPTTYNSNNAIDSEGANTPWPAVKYIVSTGDRLVGFGAYEPAAGPTVAGSSFPAKDGRVYFSPRLDASAIEDDERVSNTTTFQGWTDVARNAGSEDRALAGPLDGQVFVFFSRGITMLVPTGDARVPFRKIELSPSLGAVNNWSTFIGEDEAGRACLYWLDPVRGPYRYGADGLQWCGYDVQDIWATFLSTATERAAHGVFDPVTRMCLWWIATTGGAGVIPDTVMAFYVTEGQPVRNADGVSGVRYGWTIWTGDAAKKSCSCIFAKTLGATMSRIQAVYGANSSTLERINDAAATADNSVAFQAYVRSRAWEVAPRTNKKKIVSGPNNGTYLLAAAASGVTIQQSFTRNFGDETNRTSTRLLTATAAGETAVLVKFEDAELTDAYTFQTTLGDVAAMSNGWSLHDWFGIVEVTNEAR